MTNRSNKKTDELANQLEAAILRRADQSEPSRRGAYERLSQIVSENLKEASSPKVREQAKALLEQTVIQVEYRVVSRKRGADAEPRSAAASDALIDQLAFLKSSDELEFGYGPRYEVVDGRLSILPNVAPAEEAGRQRGLHGRLKIGTRRLNRLLAPSKNQYPVLAEVAAEYGALLDVASEALDITSLWSVGDALSSLSSAYRKQNAKATMASPLEPELHAMLDNVVREHGAFIMGFDEARTLIERADQFAMNGDVLRQIQKPGHELLVELSENRQLVTDTTIALHSTILSTVNEAGWTTGRAGFISYLVVRNAISAIIRTTIGSELSIVGVAAATSLLAEAHGISHREFLINGASVLRAQSQNILLFFSHSREFLDYVSWALELLERDREVMSKKEGEDA